MLVTDASVAVKWVYPELDSDRARELKYASDSFIAPDLIVVELGNAIWKRAVRGTVDPADAIGALEIATGLLTRLVPTQELAPRAIEIAIALRHPIYDCFYLALAERERVPLVTADKRLLAVAKQAKGVEVRAL
jgi:predicted nucleic acid-binding protein